MRKFETFGSKLAGFALCLSLIHIFAETSIGRMTKKSPVGAFQSFGKSGWLSAGGWINAIIPILIVPDYSVIGEMCIRDRMISGACSLEEPQPKFLPATMISPGLIWDASSGRSGENA